MMFKNAEAQDYVRLAYLTGILPMVRSKGQSAVNNFDEYTMTDPRVSVRKRVCGSGLSAAAAMPAAAGDRRGVEMEPGRRHGDHPDPGEALSGFAERLLRRDSARGDQLREKDEGAHLRDRVCGKVMKIKCP